MGGKIEVLLVEDRPGSLSFVSLAVRMGCVSAGACGAHGSCAGGNCTCAVGYSGTGACVRRRPCRIARR